MNTAELLQKRYKVIAPYPCSPFKIGDILSLYEYVGIKYYSTYRSFKGNDEHIYASDIENYPNIFEQIPWYADRKVEDMPEYVRPIDDKDRVDKAEWSIKDGVITLEICGYSFEPDMNNVQPATEQDYITFKQSQNER